MLCMLSTSLCHVDVDHTVDLHWLPIHQRILYKLSTIVYKCIRGAAPSSLTNLRVPVATNTSRRYLRSATHGNLLVPRTRTVTYGPQCFAVSGSTVWNTAIDPACIDHHTRTVSEWTKDNTVSLGLRGMTRRFCDCLGR